MWGKHLNCAKLQAHIAKLRKRNLFWQSIGSQAVQDICQRIEKAYQLFFNHHKKGVRPSNFKKVHRYKSFTLKQAGYKIESPQFLKQSLAPIQKASRQHFKKVKGSANRERARKHLVRKHEDVSNRRSDWFWKLAHDLTDRFDVLWFETLNLKGMQRLWGRKISDLAFGEFIKILEWVAQKKEKQVVFIDRWYPSSKTCNHCGHVLKALDLSCENGAVHPANQNGRDENAAQNIKRLGHRPLS
ncbi:RNA-guided endonuclease InsQ/TnpB family protein [Phormidesmis priestleyi]